MSQWILCKDELPPINTNILVCSGTRLKFINNNVKEVNEYIVGYYNGIHTRKMWHFNKKGEMIEEDKPYHRWVYYQGMSVGDKHPIAWSYIDEFKGETDGKN